MPDVGLGVEMITQTASLNVEPIGEPSAVLDVDIPTGKVVLSSGVQVDSFGNAFMSADGPHPTDDTKWRFQVSINEQNGGVGFSMNVTAWTIVANAAS